MSLLRAERPRRMGGSILSVTALVTDYQPPQSVDTEGLHDWTWWWEHTRWRIPQELMNNLRMFPCRIGEKPAFLCDFDVSDREQIYWIRKELARYIPEHASDLVFYQSSRPWAGRAIRQGLSFLYMVETSAEPEIEEVPTVACDGCGTVHEQLVAIGDSRVCFSCIDKLAEATPHQHEEGKACQGCGAPADRSLGEVSVCGGCVDRASGIFRAA